jgi:uncharacterized protein YebE (UPF0316 family)
MTTFLLAALLIFGLRLTDISFYTLRLMMMVRHRKTLAFVFAFCQASVYVISLRLVFSDLGNWGKILGYAAGFATGLVVGMGIENRLAVGYTHLRIISSQRGSELAGHLREGGYAVTEISAWGKDGAVTVLSCNVERRNASYIDEIVSRYDPGAFITSENMQPVQRGFWRV